MGGKKEIYRDVQFFHRAIQLAYIQILSSTDCCHFVVVIVCCPTLQSTSKDIFASTSNNHWRVSWLTSGLSAVLKFLKF